MKRRHGAVIYVPERERELVARLTRQIKGRMPAKVVAALYREILSSSRAAQGQGPIGLLESSLPVVLPAAHLNFGACDRFVTKKSWPGIATSIKRGSMSLALLTGSDLIRALQTQRWRTDFCERFDIVGDFTPVPGAETPFPERILIVTPRPETPPRRASRFVILIECKSTLNAIKSLLRAMPSYSIKAEPLIHRPSPSVRGSAVALALLHYSKTVDGTEALNHLKAARKSTGLPLSILGIYAGSEDYGG
jgi:hypothetical protein